MTYHLTIAQDLVTRFFGQLNGFYFVSAFIILNHAIRKSSEIIITQIKTLLRFDGQSYHSVENSKYSHRQTNGLANHQGKALTTGCAYSNNACSFKTEIMDMTTLKWTESVDYPFGSK